MANSSQHGSAVNQVKETAEQLAEKGRQAGAAVADRADAAAGWAGSGLESAADTIREHSPNSGMIGSAATRVADTLESGGKYLEREGVTGMFNDVTDLVKKNPIPALLVAFGIGVLIARSTRS
jgi:phage-related minor tail protein